MNISPSNTSSNTKFYIPSGSGAISKVLRANCYVDKTEYIYDLLTQDKTVVILRPRRFGKTLFVDTIESICKGANNRLLFKKCHIASTDYSWETYPIVRIDFSRFKSYNLEAQVVNELAEIAQPYGCSIKSTDVKTAFNDIFVSLANIFGEESVVCLFDEYDYPALHPELSPEDEAEVDKDPTLKEKLMTKLRNKIRATMMDIFLSLKANVKKCRLQFVTGITKHDLSDIFTAANHLEDISLTDFANSMFGFTRTEIQTHFNQQIDVVAKKLFIENEIGRSRDRFWNKLEAMYNGYRFCGDTDTEPVFSPWAILQVFAHKRMSYYWADSGNPTAVVREMIASPNKYKSFFNDMDSVRVEIESTDLAYAQLLEVLLFQTGYLTIESYSIDTMKYTLKFANEDSKKGFRLSFLAYIKEQVEEYMENHKLNINHIMNEKQVDELVKIINSAFNSIPYLLSSTLEKHYHSNLHMFFFGCGITTDTSTLPTSESLTSAGRSDLIIKLDNVIYIVEIKHNAHNAEGALRQIEDRSYFEPYQNEGKDLVLLGLNFTNREHKIEHYKYKILLKENLYNFEKELEVTQESSKSPGMTSNSDSMATQNDQIGAEENLERQSAEIFDNPVLPKHLPITRSTAQINKKRRLNADTRATTPRTQNSVEDQGSQARGRVSKNVRNKCIRSGRRNTR